MQLLSQRILEEFQIRKTGKQKSEFIEFLKQELSNVTVESGGFGKNRNIIVGDPDKAKIVFGAHYDTCAVLPFPNLILPKNLFISLLYGLLIAIPFLLVTELSMLALLFLTDNFSLAYIVSTVVLFVSLFGVMMFGPPNKHTANDNTSGVIVLTELILGLPQELRETCAFVFFDNEENGLLGSSFFAKKHRAAMKHKLLINLDCVGDGAHMMFVLNKPAMKRYGQHFRAVFTQTESHFVLHEKSATTLYPSDQANFPVSVAVAALKKHRLFGYYMNRIHTKWDTVCEEANIHYLTDGFAAFLTKVCGDGGAE